MKRIGNLYPKIYDFENLYNAYLNARKNKRYRNEVLRYTFNLEEQLITLQNELIYRTYQVGRYREFYVHDPKKRLIMALPFKDRVLQWALNLHIEPIFEKTFIYDSYACRKGKGTHKAVNRVQKWLYNAKMQNKELYCLKLDVAKFFYRIHQDTLIKIINKRIKCADTMWLIERIVKSENDQQFGINLGDHHYERGKVDYIGIPIGNLTSQLFANVYLNELDQFVKHELKCKHYVRYMDDMCILSEDKHELHRIKAEIEAFLECELKLNLNNKTAIFPANKGIDFLGHKIFYSHKRLGKKTAKKLKRRTKAQFKKYLNNDITCDEMRSTVASYEGMLQQADCFKMRKKLYEQLSEMRRK